jgi:hypothetical protein
MYVIRDGLDHFEIFFFKNHIMTFFLKGQIRIWIIPAAEIRPGKNVPADSDPDPQHRKRKMRKKKVEGPTSELQQRDGK